MNPFDIPEPTPEQANEQVRQRDQLVQASMFASDHHVIGLDAGETAHQRTKVAVVAAIGYLIGHGLITMLPDDQWLEWLNIDIPKHLKP